MMNLKISDQQLHQTLKDKAAEERRITKEIIIYIEEVIRRKLYLKYECSSLHQYLTEKIKYSDGCAQRRIDAARILSQVPEVALAIEDGRLNLTQVAKVQQGIREVNKIGKIVDAQKQKEILLKLANQGGGATDLIISRELDISIKTYDKRKVQKDESVRLEMTFSKEEMDVLEEAQALLSNKTGGRLRDTFIEMARKVIKDSKPRLPSDATSKVKPLSGSKQSSNAKSSSGSIRSQSSKIEALSGSKLRSQSSKVEALSDSNLRLQSSKIEAKIEGSNLKTQVESESKPASQPQAKSNIGTQSQLEMNINNQKVINLNLTSTAAAAVKLHTTTSAAIEIHRADIELKELIEPKEPVEQKKPKELKNVTPRLKKEIKLRDQICQWIDPTTKKPCGTRFFLQVDHIHLKSLGGPNIPSNLRMLCKNHNIFRYKQNI